MPSTDEQKPKSKPDDLVKSDEIELTEKELDKATGGVDGELTDAKHRG